MKVAVLEAGIVKAKSIADFKKLISGLAAVACICGLSGPIIAADERVQAADSTAASQSKGKPSLIEMAPMLSNTARRYPKFYGDENTTHGNILERSELVGNPAGVRDDLVDHGVYVDFGVTQFLQGNVSGGGTATSKARGPGSADGWLWLDSGKAGLWPMGAVFLHAEGTWNDNINTDVGSMLPANQDATMPDPAGTSWALSELYLLQALPGNLLAAAGKINLAAWADNNTFANNERTQFQYTGLVNNAIIGSFVPYTALSAWVAWQPTKEHKLIGVFSQSDGAATVTGFDTLVNGDNTFAVEYAFSTKLGKLPGNYKIDGLYTTKEVTNFQISDRHFVAEATGLVPVDKKDGNYTLLLSFDQYLWVDDESAGAYAGRQEKSRYSGSHRHHNPPVGIGLFGRAGWAPSDRNVIDRFYSFGIGGYGMLIPGRDDDNWGIGWAGTHISSDLRDFPVGLRSFEHAGEAFYNFWLTPAVHLSLNAQVIRPADDTLDNSWTIGTRLQLDF
jgi:porin